MSSKLRWKYMGVRVRSCSGRMPGWYDCWLLADSFLYNWDSPNLGVFMNFMKSNILSQIESAYSVSNSQLSIELDIYSTAMQYFKNVLQDLGLFLTITSKIVVFGHRELCCIIYAGFVISITHFLSWVKWGFVRTLWTWMTCNWQCPNKLCYNKTLTCVFR